MDLKSINTIKEKHLWPSYFLVTPNVAFIWSFRSISFKKSLKFYNSLCVHTVDIKVMSTWLTNMKHVYLLDCIGKVSGRKCFLPHQIQMFSPWNGSGEKGQVIVSDILKKYFSEKIHDQGKSKQNFINLCFICVC